MAGGVIQQTSRTMSRQRRSGEIEGGNANIGRLDGSLTDAVIAFLRAILGAVVIARAGRIRAGSCSCSPQVVRGVTGLG